MDSTSISDNIETSKIEAQSVKIEGIIDDKTDSVNDLWDQIGFHKPMAGFWFNILYTLIAIVLSSVLMGAFMNAFFPYPESLGYKDVAANLFGFLFMLFDIATGAVMNRFIPEVNIKNPEKMLHLIQYFIWYQMFSGLIQTTMVSVYAIFFVSRSNLAYLTWLMLIVSTTQYPGFLGVFANILDSLQQYHKAQTTRFLSGTIVQRVVELVFIITGRYIGIIRPEIGEIMGIAIGSAIGLYVSQFLAMIIAAIFFRNTMKIYGIRVRDCFKIQFTWIEVKPAVIYAVKTSVPGIIGGGLSLFNLTLWIMAVPQYTTILVLSYIGGSISDVMDWFGTPNITSLVSESYMNNKKKLTQYYVGQLARFYALLQSFIVPILIIVFLIIPLAWEAMGMVFYVGGTIFIIPRMIKLIIQKYTGIPGQILYGGDRPSYGMIMGIIQSIINTGLLYLYLVVWKLPLIYGVGITALIMELGLIPLDIIFAAIAYTYVHKTMLKIRIPFAQIIIGLIVPSVLSFGVMFLIKNFVFDTLYPNIGFGGAVIPSILLIFGVLLFVFFPLTAVFGGWDSVNLNEFRKVSKMSGPSKILVIPLYFVVNSLCQKSKLFGRAKELLEIKRTKREELKVKLANEK
jgi:hypothetical protein